MERQKLTTQPHITMSAEDLKLVGRVRTILAEHNYMAAAHQIYLVIAEQTLPSRIEERNNR